MQKHRAIVKWIVSGDTLLVRPISASSSNEDQLISVNYIRAPSLAQPPSNADGSEGSNDEPYAFESREYLRKKLIGNTISYTIDFQIPQSNRLICNVYFGPDQENLAESLVSQGLAEVRVQKGIRANNRRYQRLLHFDRTAKENRFGRYSDDPEQNHIRNIQWTLTDPERFFQQQKSSPLIDAIVEVVRDGNTVRCLLLPSYQLATIQFTGIHPSLIPPDDDDGTSSAMAAKEYLRSCLLQRDVKVMLNTVIKETLFGTLFFPENQNISLYLLEKGLAKCLDRALPYLPSTWIEQYRAAEQSAKDQRLGLWAPDKNIQSAEEPGRENMFPAEVLEIVNADALIVRDLRNNQIQKIFLSSIRAFRAADFATKSEGKTGDQRVVKRPLFDIPFLWDGREFLRKQLIGKKVLVVIDYILEATETHPEKVCATVSLDSINIGERLIAKGLAKIVRNGDDDGKISSCYNALLQAQHQAIQRSMGVYSKYSGLHRVTDLTGVKNKERAKLFVNELRSTPRMEGVIESVASGSHFRIYLHREHYLISFVCSSIQCPRLKPRVATDENSGEETIEPAEPFAVEALHFAKEHFLQRDVMVTVESVDPSGNFIGHFTTVDGKSPAWMLVQAGLAKVLDSARHAPNYPELLQAQKECQHRRIGIWTNMDDSMQEEPNQNNTEEGVEHDSDTLDFTQPSFRRVIITYITSESEVYVHFSEQGQLLEQLQADLQEIIGQTLPENDWMPKKNELVAAQFSADNRWYRARVKNIKQDKRVSVYFIDYGNREVITSSRRLIPLPENFQELPEQAHKYALAYVQIPPKVKNSEQAKNALLNDIGNDEYFMRVEYQEDNLEYISLYHSTSKVSLAKQLSDKGLVTITHGESARECSPGE